MKILLLTVCLALASCATDNVITSEESTATIKASFAERGIAKLDRLDQSDLQKTCSNTQIANYQNLWLHG